MDLLYLPIIIITLFILIIISYQDIKKREINISYLIYLVIFSIVYLGFFVFKNNFLLWKQYFLQILIIFGFLLIFFILGKISKLMYIGEGDLYTLLALSFTNIFSEFFILSIIIIALLFTLLVPVCLFLYNLFTFNFPKYKGIKGIITMFLGLKIKVNKLNSFYYSLEKFNVKNNNLSITLRFKPNIEPAKEIKEIKKLSKEYGIKKVWASPLIPFIVSITFAYIVMIIFLFFNITNIFFFFL